MFFLFVTAKISLLVTTLVMNILFKQRKLKTLVASLALQQIKVGVVATQERSNWHKVLNESGTYSGTQF